MKKQGKLGSLVLRKETIQQLATKDLENVAGGAPWSVNTNCPLTKDANGKTCASFEFAC